MKAEGVEMVDLFHMSQAPEQRAGWTRIESGSAGAMEV